MMFKKTILSVFFLASALPVYAFDSKITDSAVGCSDQSQLESLLRYARENDKAAFTKGLMAGVADGTCTMFQPGEKVFVSDVKWSGLNKVRKQGDTKEFWVVREAMQR
ncbi:hypothetical protein ACQE3E_15575 [Methylomonas sp. MED-D]|uniref:hypothetical protein n=1 Tax=unclassified Methylomonas TaxID=2608980 RepID=UPI003CFDD5DB